MQNFWNQLKWKIQMFMRGRNGLDDLGKMTVYASLALYVVGILFHSGLLDILSFGAMIYAIFRICSKNLYARREENRKFVTWMETTRVKMSQRKDYKIFKCKGCGRTIRVPRGKGKIEVTCPMCGNKTIHRT